MPTMVLAEEDMTGKFALGFFSSDAPVSIRYMATSQIGVDLGLGFRSVEVFDADTAATTTNTSSFWFELGIPYKVYEGGDRAHFFVRPGFVLGILDDRDPTNGGTGVLDETWMTVDIYLALGAELFFGDHFSVEATHGALVNIIMPPDQVSDESFMNFGTFGEGLTSVGFRYYF
jgi:hypothetical protein